MADLPEVVRYRLPSDSGQVRELVNRSLGGDQSAMVELVDAYRGAVLEQVAKLPTSRLELAESLEQLRWLENGFSIGVVETDLETQGIDTPEDLEQFS